MQKSVFGEPSSLFPLPAGNLLYKIPAGSMKSSMEPAGVCQIVCSKIRCNKFLILSRGEMRIGTTVF